MSLSARVEPSAVAVAHAEGDNLPEISPELVGELGNPDWEQDPSVWYRSAIALGGLFLLGYLGTWIVVVARDRRRGP